MYTMEALGAGPKLSPNGETPGLNLGADAETLALFASLFAMMQTSEQDGKTEGPVPQAQQLFEETKPLLPATARLMAKLAPTAPVSDRQIPLADLLANDLEKGEDEPGDTAGLLKLLLAAHEIAAPDHQSMMPTDVSDDNVTVAAPTRTATEMLTGAIEILKSLDAGAMPLTPVEENLDQIATKPAQVMVLRADPDFIGPMPVVTELPKQSASEVVMPADPDFVGLKEEEQSSAEPRTPAILLQADPDFIGPMPAVKPPVTLVEHTGLLPADPDFIGPMPDVTPTGQAKVVAAKVVAAPSSDFMGPIPVVTPKVLATAEIAKVVAAPSPDFIGPMPTIATASTVQRAEASSAVLNGVDPAPAITDIAATPTAEQLSLIDELPDIVGPAISTTGGSTAPNPGATPTSTHGSIPNPHAELQQFVKSGLLQQATSEKGANEDAGLVSRRVDMVKASNDKDATTANQQRTAEFQTKGVRITSKASNLLQGSATSTSAPAQHAAATSKASNLISSASGSDSLQNVVSGTAGGQSGGQSGGQQSTHQSVDSGIARGAADRTLLHRLNTDNASWSETMVKRLTADLRSGVQNVRIILEPQQLGRLNIELGLRNGQASIRIAAETQEAAKLLSGARVQLGQMLESAGLRLAGFQATGSQAGDTGLDTGQGSQGRGSEGSSDNAGRNNAGRDQNFSNKMATALDDIADDLADGDATLREGETAVLSILA